MGLYSTGYWRIADSWITHSSMTNERLKNAGYPTLYDEYLKWYPNKEPPRAEPHAWWWERSENESRKKTISFSSYSIMILSITILDILCIFVVDDLSEGILIALKRFFCQFRYIITLEKQCVVGRPFLRNHECFVCLPFPVEVC